MSHQTENETFFSNEVSWGMLSNTSLYGGLLLSGDDYHSAAIGIGQNMLWLGALSFDVRGPVVTLILSRTSGA
ncbi:outer membrane protein [Escherichia coli]|uniref:Outer membrane protein n=1 Tax=Escherichia coli TaxID=562 RepID=A0A376TIH6_ECOLX|nr:outer membrane protein [Escherichia coli]